MEEITLKLQSKKEVIDIIIALIKVQTMTMVKDEELINLTARLIMQASQMMTTEE